MYLELKYKNNAKILNSKELGYKILQVRCYEGQFDIYAEGHPRINVKYEEIDHMLILNDESE